MLGKLLQTAGASLYPTVQGRGVAILESTTDEQHTRDLLFTTSSYSFGALTGSLRPGPFDDHGGLDIAESDIRIIIAQDAFRDQEKPCVLLDTKKQDTPHRTSLDARRSAEPASAEQKTTGSSTAAANGTGARASVPKMPQLQRTPSAFQSRNRSATSSGGTIESKSSDEIDNYLDCMFGVSSMKKAEACTKMHVMSPTSARPLQAALDVGSSPGMGTKIRREPFTRAQPRDSTLKVEKIYRPDQEVLLVTRLFTVSLDSEGALLDERSAFHPNGETHESMGETFVSPGSKPPKLREKKVPAYAIGLVIQLPRRALVSPHLGQRGGLKSPMSSQSLRSFDGSGSNSSWTLLEAMPPALRPKEMTNHLLPGRSQVEEIVKNWDVIIRSLLSLERDAKKEILQLLRQTDKIARSSLPVKVPKEKAMQRTNQRIVQLPPYSLARIDVLRDAASNTLHRIRYGIRIPRVTIHSLSYVHWREEVRVICRRTSQRAFFYSLFTAFLGTHTGWLCDLESKTEKKRPKAKPEDRQASEVLACRTVIVCEQRILARRLVYLLAAFLAPLGIHALQYAAASDDLYSSPDPKPSPVGRESLLSQQLGSRFKMESDPDPRLHDTHLSRSTDTDHSGTTENAHESGRHRPINSRLSELTTAGGLAIPYRSQSTRKSSGGTTATVTPDVVTPTAHLSSQSSQQSGYFPKYPGITSSESLASADLARLLRRSSSGRSTSSSQWGSLLSNVSGFWSTSDKPSSSASTTGFIAPGPLKGAASTLGKAPSAGFSKMRGHVDSASVEADPLRLPSASMAALDDTVKGETSSVLFPGSMSPPKFKVDEIDGVVDVDLDFSHYFQQRHGLSSSPDFKQSSSPSSLQAPFSPRSVGSPSQSALSNVAAYLPHYHPDLALQAVTTSATLEDAIRASMSSEPTPAANSLESPASDWTTVCTTLIADVRTFTIKRLTLKRHSRPRSSEVASALRRTSSSDLSESEVVSPLSTTESVHRDVEEEKFVSETVTEYDSTLANAIERVLGNSSANASRTPSPSRSMHSRTISNSSTSTRRTNPAPTPHPTPFHKSATPMDIPRRDYGRVVVGALEEVVRSVNNGLHNSSQQARRTSHAEEGRTSPAPPSREVNALREGVKQWLLRHEHAGVW